MLVALFQSAPLTKARGDVQPPQVEGEHASFNPLPSPKQGETDDLTKKSVIIFIVSIRSPHQSKGRQIRELQRDAQILVSIRSPHQSKGRHLRPAGLNGECNVSIRSPHQSKGRPWWPDAVRDRLEFQSAPLTKARGDPLTAEVTTP